MFCVVQHHSPGRRAVEHGLPGTGALRGNGYAVDDALAVPPLGWEYINLTGDYLWHRRAKIGVDKFRPLRPFPGS